MIALFPSLISANLLELKKVIDLIDPYVHGYHLDVMDFHFVPNLTWGPPFINEIRTATQKPLFIHLMVEYPEKYFDRLYLSNGDTVAIHYESPSQCSIEELFRQINTRGWVPSIALNPSTKLDPVFFLKDLLQSVLLMSVEPGFSGQTFIPDILEKLQMLDSWRLEHDLSFIISVDGGINDTNCRQLRSLGANQIALASAIFDTGDLIKSIKNILKNC